MYGAHHDEAHSASAALLVHDAVCISYGGTRRVRRVFMMAREDERPTRFGTYRLEAMFREGGTQTLVDEFDNVSGSDVSLSIRNDVAKVCSSSAEITL
jgi:hypothetical protein